MGFLFSIIIPTYNEEKDIRATLESLLELAYQEKEIIVVDDSIDDTPKIISDYADRGVKLICPEVRKGRCEARNIGIQAATGDVVVILNADVLLPTDFLDRIKPHYDNGYDSVTVFSEVANMEKLYARYVGLHHLRKVAKGVYEKRKTTLKGLYWSEGFSVRRELVMKTALFPSGFVVPIVAGEDVRFVDELRKLECKGVVDDATVIRHVAPDNLAEYWKIRKGRGAGTPQIRRFIDRWSHKKIFTILATKAAIRLLKFIALFPVLRYNWELAGYGERNRFAETFRLSWCWMVEQAAFTVGEFQSLQLIIAKEKEQ
jgi:glycosyltransferase involved in cell wall biosynthesis